MFIDCKVDDNIGDMTPSSAARHGICADSTTIPSGGISSGVGLGGVVFATGYCGTRSSLSAPPIRRWKCLLIFPSSVTFNNSGLYFGVKKAIDQCYDKSLEIDKKITT